MGGSACRSGPWILSVPRATDPPSTYVTDHAVDPRIVFFGDQCVLCLVGERDCAWIHDSWAWPGLVGDIPLVVAQPAFIPSSP